MIKRKLQSRLLSRLQNSPAVVLLGPRQVGKTTLARAIAADWPGGGVYLDMERPADLRRLEDADSYLRSQSGKLVVIDEIHRVPDLFVTLRGIIDDNRAKGIRSGQFLLLGSASLDLMHQASESLAGRIAYLDLTPIQIDEASSVGIDEFTLWVRGGFPDSLLASSDATSMDWRRDFVRSYLERDVPMFAPRIPAAAVGRLWTMLANNQGGLLNQSRLASSLGVSVVAVRSYLDLLSDLMLVRQLRPWSGNLGKRLVKSPKIYVRDSGLLHALLELETMDQLLGHPLAGPSYEGMVIENLVKVAGAAYIPYFYRTHQGAEIDLVLERGGRPEIAIEVKRSSAPKLELGFSVACDDLDVKKRFVVYPGSERYGLKYGAEAISLGEMAALLRADSAGLGAMKGQIKIADDFDAPLPGDIQPGFEGNS